MLWTELFLFTDWLHGRLLGLAHLRYVTGSLINQANQIIKNAFVSVFRLRWKTDWTDSSWLLVFELDKLSILNDPWVASVLWTGLLWWNVHSKDALWRLLYNWGDSYWAKARIMFSSQIYGYYWLDLILSGATFFHNSDIRHIHLYDTSTEYLSEVQYFWSWFYSRLPQLTDRGDTFLYSFIVTNAFTF
jgi:hypothetical protein